jgi:hypothetical protein
LCRQDGGVSQDTKGFPPVLILIVLVRKAKQVARYYHQNQDGDNSSRPEPPLRKVSRDKRPDKIDRKPESNESRQDVDAETKDP